MRLTFLTAALAFLPALQCQPPRTKVRFFSAVQVSIITGLIFDPFSGGLPEETLALPLADDASVFLPSPGLTLPRITVRGECDGTERVRVALVDEDVLFDDQLDRAIGDCDKDGRFEVELTIFCLGNPEVTVDGPLASSGEIRADVYVRDVHGNQRVPFPGGDHAWIFVCAGADLDVQPRGSGGHQSDVPLKRN